MSNNIDIIKSYFDDYKDKICNLKYILINDDSYSDRSEGLVQLINEIDSYIDGNLNGITEFTDNLTRYIVNIFDNFFEDLNYIYTNIYDEQRSILPPAWDSLKKLKRDIKKIDYLYYITNKVSIFIGKNGSGKSSFAGYLSESFSSNLVVIPAQKTLLLDSSPDDYNLSDRNIINLLNNTNLIIENKSIEGNSSLYAIKDYIYKLNRDLQYSVVALINIDIDEIYNGTIDSEKKSLFEKFKCTWNNIIDDIDFKVDTYNRTLIPYKNNEPYDFNTLSDGEKTIVYYIIRILLAPPESYIFVDEPETYLNLSIMNILWDELELLRPDCKFIYLTHNLDFLRYRRDSNIFWLKNYHHPDIWDINLLDDEIGIPNSLFLEIVGNDKDILFCEGTKSSIDYAIYRCLFKHDFFVIPVGTSTNVISYTQVINNNDLFNFRALGLIDNDLIPQERIDTYIRKKVYTTPFYEIEMILLSEEIIQDYYNLFEFKGSKFKSVNDVKKSVMQFVYDNKEDIVKEFITQKFINEIHNYSPERRTSNIDTLKSDILDKINSTITDDINNSLSIINTKIESRDYDSILEIIPFKDRIVNYIGNKIDNSYKEKSIERIRLDENLQIKLRDKYFKNLI